LWDKWALSKDKLIKFWLNMDEKLANVFLVNVKVALSPQLFEDLE
jgi:hypothetical protein